MILSSIRLNLSNRCLYFSKVVQQIDFLTSSIDLNEEEQQQSGHTGGESTRPHDDSGSSPSSSEVTVRRSNQRPSDSEDKPGDADSSATLRINHRSRNRSPPTVLLTTVTSGFLTDRKRHRRFASSLGSSTAQDGPQQLSPPLQNQVSYDLTPSPQRDLPVRPPTPGLSPLTVNLHHASGPGSPPRSPGPSSSTIKVSPSSPVFPKPPPPPTLCPSVIIENKIKSYQTAQSDPPSADQPCPSVTQPPSAGCPPTSSAAQTVPSHDGEPPASFAGPIIKLSKAGPAAAAAKTKPPTSQDRRGRKPPPYPHQGASELTKKAKEPRKAPPYPEKRRLLSTTVWDNAAGGGGWLNRTILTAPATSLQEWRVIQHSPSFQGDKTQTPLGVSMSARTAWLCNRCFPSLLLLLTLLHNSLECMGWTYTGHRNICLG